MIELLSNTGYIIVNKTLIKRIGLHEALMLGELCSEYSYWKSTGKLDEEGYFFSTRENIEENIGLSSFQQRKAMTTLKELGIIEETISIYTINESICMSQNTDTTGVLFFEEKLEKDFSNLEVIFQEEKYYKAMKQLKTIQK